MTSIIANSDKEREIEIINVHMAKVFSTDPLFCPFCGTILPLPVNSGSVRCKLCDYQQDAAGERTGESADPDS